MNPMLRLETLKLLSTAAGTNLHVYLHIKLLTATEGEREHHTVLMQCLSETTHSLQDGKTQARAKRLIPTLVGARGLCDPNYR